MRRKEKEITDSHEIEEILFSNIICRVAFAVDNEAYLVPMNYGYRDNAIYLHTSREGKKIDMMKKNPRVSFEITGSLEIKEGPGACDYGTRFRSVIGFGKIGLVTERQEKIRALAIMMRQHTGKGEWEFRDKALDAAAVLKIEIESITGKKSGY